MIDTVIFSVFGKEWTINLMSSRMFVKKHDKESVARTMPHKRHIDLAKEDFLKETIIHELVHVFFFELCIGSCNNLRGDDVEEIAAEMFSKFGKQILELADAIYLGLTEKAVEESKNSEQVHYVSRDGGNLSPCGDNNEESSVTNDKNDVTCHKCLQALGKSLN